MRRDWLQRGFTVVELVIVLAISSLLVAGALMGQSNLRQRTALSSAADQIRGQVKSVQNQASQSVSVRSDGGTVGSSDQTVFGKLVEFSRDPANATKMRTWTLIANADNTALQKCDEKDITIENSMTYSGDNPAASQALIFTHNPEKTFTAPDGFDDASVLPSAPTCNPPAAVTPAWIGPVTPCPGGQALIYDSPTDAIGHCPGVPPVTPPAVPACDDTGYVCGLYGQYYSGTGEDADLKVLASAYIDSGVGLHLGNGGSSYPDFLPTLKARVGDAGYPSSVHWSGQILLSDTNPHQICFASDSGSHATVNGQPLTNNYGSSSPPASNCTTITAGSPGWFPIDIQYVYAGPTKSGGAKGGDTTNNIWAGDPILDTPSPFARLYENAGGSATEIPSTSLRTSASNPVMPPAASAPAAPTIVQPYDGTLDWGGSQPATTEFQVTGTRGDTVYLRVNGTIVASQKLTTGTTATFSYTPPATTDFLISYKVDAIQSNGKISPASNVKYVGVYNLSAYGFWGGYYVTYITDYNWFGATLPSLPVKALAQRLLGWMAPPASHAAATCDKRILNPQNYLADCAPPNSYTRPATIIFEVPGTSDRVTVTVNPADSGIERSVSN